MLPFPVQAHTRGGVRPKAGPQRVRWCPAVTHSLEITSRPGSVATTWVRVGAAPSTLCVRARTAPYSERSGTGSSRDTLRSFDQRGGFPIRSSDVWLTPFQHPRSEIGCVDTQLCSASLCCVCVAFFRGKSFFFLTFLWNHLRRSSGEHRSRFTLGSSHGCVETLVLMFRLPGATADFWMGHSELARAPRWRAWGRWQRARQLWGSMIR